MGMTTPNITPFSLNATLPSLPPLPAMPTFFPASPGTKPASNLPLVPLVSPQDQFIRQAQPSVNALAKSPQTQVAEIPAITGQPVAPTTWQNQLRSYLQNNQSIIYALHLRTFGARDLDGNGRIEPKLGESGGFFSAIDRLDELKALGVNTIHLLPLNPVSNIKRLGEAGSVYAPLNYHELNPQYDVPNNGMTVVEEAKKFIEEAHKRGIHVMVDIPSCASHDLAQERPDLIARDAEGNMLTPTNWIDIVMFEHDSPELREYYQGFFDLMVDQLGVDGFRVDVARARSTDFWKHFIDKYPDKGWLAETYVEEDESPLQNIPRDVPNELLKSGFDAIYGQFHIFPIWRSAKDYMDYLKDGYQMMKEAAEADPGSRVVPYSETKPHKAFIGSFLTHDDPPMLERGGLLQFLLSAGLMSVQPYSNPYILDGFTTAADSHFDIFRWSPPEKGHHPEIGVFLQQMLTLRNLYGPVITHGEFVPLTTTCFDSKGEEVAEDAAQLIAFERRHGNQRLLVLANKDVNAWCHGVADIPGFRYTGPLQNLAPGYGLQSAFSPMPGKLEMQLAPGRFYVFDISDTTQSAASCT